MRLQSSAAPSRRQIVPLLLACVLVALALGASACGGSDKNEVVVYSGREENLIKPILDDFQRDTGIDVRTKYGETEGLTATILEEGDNSRADVFIAQDAGAVSRLAGENRLEPYLSPNVRRIPLRFRARDGSWTGVSGRSRVLIVNTEELPVSQAPTSIFELTDPKWKGKLVGPDITNASFLGWVTAMRIKRGDDFTRRYLEGLKQNKYETLKSNDDAAVAVGRGEFPIGLVNHYYVAIHSKEGAPVAAVYTDQQPGGYGTIINAASAAIVRGADHQKQARRLIDYLLQSDVQRKFASGEMEYPLLPGIPPTKGVRRIEDVRPTDVQLEQLGPKVESTLALIKDVGLG